jgi:hypothetical protein
VAFVVVLLPATVIARSSASQFGGHVSLDRTGGRNIPAHAWNRCRRIFTGNESSDRHVPIDEGNSPSADPVAQPLSLRRKACFKK